MLKVRSDAKSLSGLEKTAVILLALGEERGSRLMERLEDDEIRDVSYAMAGLGTVTGTPEVAGGRSGPVKARAAVADMHNTALALMSRAHIDQWGPAEVALVDRVLAGRSATFPAKLEAGKWYTLVVETVGEEMRVTLDGKPAGYLKSSGIGHATKSKIELGVAGKDGCFDEIKVWNATPAK